MKFRPSSLLKMMNIILGSLQAAQIQRFRGSFGYLGAIIPVQVHVDSSSLFPSLGAAGSYSKKTVNTLNTHSKTHRGAALTSGTKGISLPSQCTASVFSFLNFNPKRQRYLFGEVEHGQRHKSNLSLFLFLISLCTTAVQVFSLARATSAFLGILNLQIKCLEIMPQ